MKRNSEEIQTPHVTTGSVLDELGFSPDEALEMRVKADIYRELLHHIKSQGFTQQQLATALGIHQPDVSHLLHGRLSRFSIGKLIKFAGRLNLGATVMIVHPQQSAVQTTKPRKRSAAVA